MKFTIGNKLALSFGAIVGLMTLSSALVYYNIAKMQRNIESVVEEATPTVRACDLALNGLNQTVAALRGFMILGNDAAQAEYFKGTRAEGWQVIDESFSDLKSFADRWDASDRQAITEAARDLESLRIAQQEVEAIAHTPENIPAQQLFVDRIAPSADQAFDVLTEMIEPDAVREASQEGDSALKDIADLRGYLSKAVLRTQWYLFTGDASARNDVASAVETFNREFEKLAQSKARFSESQQRGWLQISQLQSELMPRFDELVALRGANDWNRARHLTESVVVPLTRDLREILDTITKDAETRKAAMQAEMTAAARSTRTSLIAATATAVIAAVTIAVLLTRRIVAMIRALTTQAGSIASGDLRGQGLKLKSADELGQLADGFDTMLLRLKDLTGQVISVTENVNSTAAQISSSASQQASSSKQQATTVQEITSTMQELSQTGAQIIDKAKELSAAAEASMETSKNGMSAVQETNRSMEAIREQVEDVAENIVALSERTQAIGNIVATVNEVAEQSNLLALNATIEAVSAGEQGSRFSVVANEMKNLADQAKQCTVQVRDHLGEIQKGINSSVMLTEEAVKRVEAGKQRAKVTEDTIRKMSETTNESVRTFQQIIGATNQQQIGFEQVTQGMEEIREATQQTATGTAQLEQAVGSLSALSHQLKAAVGSYQL